MMILILVAVLYLPGWLDFAERKLMDLRFPLSQRNAGGDLVVVAIDPVSLKEVGIWPWPRSLHATVLKKILDAGARSVAFDIDFSSRSDSREDRVLEEVLAGSGGKVVLPAFKQISQSKSGEVHLTYTAPITEFRKHVRLASINVRPEADGLVRRMSESESWRNIELPTMATLLADRVRPPVGSYFIDFGIDPASIPRIPFADVLNGRFDAQAIAGKQVLIGSTAVELGDQIAVPKYRALAGVLLQALAYESLMQGRALRHIAPLVTLLIAGLFALFLGPLLVTSSWRWGLIGTGVAWGASAIASVALQTKAAMVLDITPWLLVSACSYAYGMVNEIDRQALRVFLSSMAAVHRTIAVRNLIENSVDGIVTVDWEGKIDTLNAAASRMFGYATEELKGNGMEILIPDLGRGYSATDRATSLRESEGRHKNGTVFPIDLLTTEVNLTASKHKLERRETARSSFIHTIRDTTERKRSEDALRESERRYRQMFQKNRAIKLLIDPSTGAIVDANQAAVDFYGYDMESLKTFNIGDINGLSRTGVAKEMAAVLSEEQTYAVSRHRLLSGEMRDVEIHAGPIEIDARTIVFAIIHDITDRRRAEERIQHMATHDGLTGLANRVQFMDRLEIALAQARRDSKLGAVHFIDLDKFKLVNDAMGHDAGDRLLQGVAQRIERCIRETDAVARFGGDEFAILQPGLRNPDDATTLAIKIRATLSRPFITTGQEIHTGASIGITMFPNDGTDPARLLNNADLAMYRAKREGGNAFCFFVADMDFEAQTRVSMERDMRRALENNEFSLHFQPQVCLESGHIRSMEALLRWDHPEHGIIPPATFIPVAESSSLIHAIGAWTLRTACKQARATQRLGHPPIGVSVNLSPAQFRDQDLTGLISDALDESSLDPSLLELEVTENVIMRQNARTSFTLKEIGQLGVSLAIDDFGVGYSSFSYLREFPFTKLKIDRSFIRDIGADSGSDAIMRGMIHMGQGLDMKVVAEGVETLHQFDYLREHRCDEGQGFFFSRPVAINHVGSLIDEWVPFRLEEAQPGD
jgi:diguanylate cyclase (GGDEF)-like protein/PAS domain S-box-containing protein